MKNIETHKYEADMNAIKTFTPFGTFCVHSGQVNDFLEIY
jgi:hypothetical protein